MFPNKFLSLFCRPSTIPYMKMIRKFFLLEKWTSKCFNCFGFLISILLIFKAFKTYWRVLRVFSMFFIAFANPSPSSWHQDERGNRGYSSGARHIVWSLGLINSSLFLFFFLACSYRGRRILIDIFVASGSFHHVYFWFDYTTIIANITIKNISYSGFSLPR